jgi:hypothetical protein
VECGDGAQLTDIVTAAFTALAALAALLTVWHATRTWRRSLLPELHGQVQSRQVTWQANSYELVIHNAGSRVAKAPLFALVSGQWLTAGAVDPGFLLPGETVIVKTFIVAEPEDADKLSVGVLACRDTDENTWAWNLRGNRKLVQRWKPPWWRFWTGASAAATIEEMLKAFHPEVDVDSLTEVEHEIIRQP